MYKMTEIEFQRYINAEETFDRLCKEQLEELEDAYGDIHPTRTMCDYGTGKYYSESLNVADYAIYLVELKDNHKKDRERWERRIRVFQSAMNSLTDEERFIYSKSPASFKDYELYHEVLNTLRKYLEEIVSTIPELQRVKDIFTQEEIARYDAKVDKMSVTELFEDLDTNSPEDVLKSLNPTDSNLFERFTQAALVASNKIAY